MGSSISVAAASSAGLTAEQRWRDVQDFTNEYLEYLSTTGGAVLTTETRLQVAQMALGALTCTSCASLPKDACLRKGCNIYETIGSLDTHGLANSTKENVLCHLVHSIINHQGRLTVEWYQTTLEKLDVCGWIDETVAPKGSTKRTYLLYSLFSEVLLVATMVHCLNTVYLVMDRDMPELPVASPAATPPNMFDWTLAVKQGQSTTTKGCWTPHFVASQVHPSTPMPNNIENIKTLLPFEGPYIAAHWSVCDMDWILRMQEFLYLDTNEMFAMHRPLSPKTKCAQSFSRRDMEFIANVIAESYDCAF